MMLRRLIVVLVTLLASYCLWGQSTNATISGRVADQSGAAIPNAKIVAVNVDTNVNYSTETNGVGFYVINTLPPGRYRILVSKAGFAQVVRPDVQLHVQDDAGINFAMRVGSAAESVTVESGRPLVNTESGAVGTVVDRNFVGNLPLNGRSFQSLILLAPGVVPVAPANGNVGQFSVNGQRTNSNYFTVDGVGANTGITPGAGFIQGISQQIAGSVPTLNAMGTTQSLVSVDALEEYRLQTSTYSAEFGRQPGGQVQLATRSGNNQYHGSVFEYARNEFFDARSYFNTPPTPQAKLRQNQFGGTFGGPIEIPGLFHGKNRTFFFFSFEELRVLQPQSSIHYVPSLRLRQIAAPTLLPILNAFPLPTGPETSANGTLSGFAPYTDPYSSPRQGDAISLRIDHTINSKLSLFGRYNHAPSNSLNRVLNSLIGDKNSADTVTLGSNYLLSSHINNEFRFNYTSNSGKTDYSLDGFGGAVPISLSSILSGYDGPGVKQGSINFQMSPIFSSLSLGDSTVASQQQINAVDTFSVIKGSHHMRFGIDYRRLAPVYSPANYNASATFSSVSQLISGTPSLAIITAKQGARPLLHNFSTFAQDNWKISSRLTLDMGVRWEVNPPPQDENGLKPTLVTGVENLATATLAPSNSPLHETSYTAFAPRVGFAYQINKTQGHETVLSGGVGLFYDLDDGQALVGFSRYPYSASTVLRNVPYPLTSAQTQPPSFPVVALPLKNKDVTAIDPGLTLPYTLQWNLTVQQSLGKAQALSLGYVASASRQQVTTQSLNGHIGNPFTGPRTNPNFGDIYYTTNGPTADYQSLQAQFRRQLSHGLQALVNYTWAHSIDEVSDEIDNNLLRGNSDFDVRQNFTAGLTYVLPKFGSSRLVSTFVQGWSVDSTIYVRGGEPQSIGTGSFIVRPDGTLVFGRPDLVPGQPFWVKDPTAPGGQKINFAAFAIPAIDPATGRPGQGNLGRNVVRLPGRSQVNLSIGKDFAFQERLKIQFKVDAFNVFNHPLFGFYNQYLSYGPDAFGVASSTLDRAQLEGLSSLYQMGGPRSLQLSLRLAF